ncbi:hydrogenobyrinate a,c-diamide synthase [Azorhizobium oxalatiphilum]|uniref:Hydrogenobyrinate a,c-diamide synthase n=1 Tax=Azorhizobium oxalatiphilum TaxID=980631 RepID=A0A917BKT6_9HYPH|nr:cobyrinate a,c-diamide synthase [Azorhizobium oxalatiphilum]GGF46039.1 hydrogenobyrinate a,c-diamide synthase [Azorhizobium oxalatiphilum]
MSANSLNGLVIGAPRSGSGKTTVTLGLLAALARRGIKVRAAKSGPDYIDPAFHAAATGRPGLNLDSWAMPPDLVGHLVALAGEDGDLLVVEGAMGLFDGVPVAPGRTGAGADIAARLSLPVLLVLDVSGQSQTAAAVARGFATHDPRVRIGGVILNRVGSERHIRLVREAMAPLGLPVVGAIPRDTSLVLPERHLGLVQAGEHPDLPARLDALAAMAEAHLDLDAILALASPVRLDSEEAGAALPPPGQRIALARDAAFSFVYAHVLAHWRRAGAEILPFSPLADEAPDPSADVCWLPGGYPELHGGKLAAATRFKAGLTAFAQTRPVHGECGGYMVLGQGIVDADGTRHAMTGQLGLETSFAKRKMNLGYREARLLADAPIGPAGGAVRGHEFHYATVLGRGDDAPLAELKDAQGTAIGPSGSRRGQVTGAFFHAIATAS